MDSVTHTPFTPNPQNDQTKFPSFGHRGACVCMCVCMFVIAYNTLLPPVSLPRMAAYERKREQERVPSLISPKAINLCVFGKKETIRYRKGKKFAVLIYPFDLVVIRLVICAYMQHWHLRHFCVSIDPREYLRQWRAHRHHFRSSCFLFGANEAFAAGK